MDDDEESKEIIVKQEENLTVYRFKENDESKLFRKFLNNWTDTWHKQNIMERNAVKYEERKKKKSELGLLYIDRG